MVLSLMSLAPAAWFITLLFVQFERTMVDLIALNRRSMSFRYRLEYILQKSSLLHHYEVITTKDEEHILFKTPDDG